MFYYEQHMQYTLHPNLKLNSISILDACSTGEGISKVARTCF